MGKTCSLPHFRVSPANRQAQRRPHHDALATSTGARCLYCCQHDVSIAEHVEPVVSETAPGTDPQSTTAVCRQARWGRRRRSPRWATELARRRSVVLVGGAFLGQIDVVAQTVSFASDARRLDSSPSPSPPSCSLPTCQHRAAATGHRQCHLSERGGTLMELRVATQPAPVRRNHCSSNLSPHWSRCASSTSGANGTSRDRCSDDRCGGGMAVAAISPHRRRLTCLAECRTHYQPLQVLQ